MGLGWLAAAVLICLLAVVLPETSVAQQTQSSSPFEDVPEQVGPPQDTSSPFEDVELEQTTEESASASALDLIERI